MLPTVAALPLVASATSAATETQFEVLTIFFWRLMTILPIVALAVPVLVTVSTPSTVRKLALVAPRVAATVQVIAGGSSGRVILWDDGDFVKFQAVLFAWHSSALQSLSVMLAWPAGGLAAARAVAATRSIIARQIPAIDGIFRGLTGVRLVLMGESSLYSLSNV